MKVENQIENAQDTVKKSFLSRFAYIIIPYIGLCIFVLMWYVVSRKNIRIFPSPIIVLQRMHTLLLKPVSGSTLFGHIGISMRRVFIAMLFALVIGIPFGVLIGWSRCVRSTFGALFECIRPIPVLAWIPLIVMWFGIGERAKIIMIFIGALMPIVVNSYTGIKMVAPIYLDVGRMFNATSQKQLLARIVFPAALPTIFAGIRNATSVALMVVLAAEMLAAKSGLGFLICRGMEVFDISLVMTGMVCIGLTGACLAFLTNIIERKACPWNRGLSSE
jgi:NitT/TauT family transport system permease protein/sulfonate transport system permease protein